MKINLRNKLTNKNFSAIKNCIEVSRITGIKIYLVGGIVRDILLNQPVKDIDITVEGDVNVFVRNLVKYSKVTKVKYNEKLPTAKVLFKNGTEIDFAATRKEIYEQYGALPVIKETGCPLKEDIFRRDFTVNSLAVSLNSENLFEIIDYTGGLKDLKSKKLRVLHEKSFYDDPSRMIRGLKFAERLNFSLEDKTLLLQNEYIKNPLKNIPLVRVKNEIRDLFSLNKKSCFDNFVKQKLYRIFTPEYKSDLNGEKIKNIIFDFEINDEDFWLLFFIPFFTEQNPSSKFNFTSRELKIISDIGLFKEKKLSVEDKFEIYEFFKEKDYLTAVFYGLLYNIDVAKTFFRIKNIRIYVTGKDLAALGIPRGKIYSEIQKNLLKEKINKKIKNKEEEIIFIKREYIKERT